MLRMWLEFVVPPLCDGMELRRFLYQCAVSTDLTRAVKHRGSGFFVDGSPAFTNVRLQAGQRVKFDLPPEEKPSVTPQPEIPLRVVYQDAFALVIDKPAGIPVHPTLGYAGGTLANAYAAWAQQNGESGVFRPVNRLDKNTSGLLLAARNMYAANLLAEHVQKTYYAIVEGEMPLGEGVFDGPIGRAEGSIVTRCVTPAGKPSRTEYTVLAAGGGHSLAACRLITGRTHQIRVHFSHAGHPLAGDDLYGGSREIINRQALHCGKLAFSVPAHIRKADCVEIQLPLQWTEITAESPFPPDMETMKRCEN